VSQIVAVIQARMTSTRLPGKVLMDIAGKPALELMLSRVSKAKTLDRIVIATTSNATDDPVADLCRRLGVGVFRGSEVDVLERYLGAALEARATTVVRLTADCPFADPAVIDGAVDFFRGGYWDYAGNANRRTFPDGLDVEVFSATALGRAAREARHPFAREHVTPYLRGIKTEMIGDGHFRRGDYMFVADFAHVRWTLDRPDDLERLRRLASLLPEGFGWLEALSVATKFPDLLGVTST